MKNTPTRGTGFTDSLGIKYGLVYITTTITNDTNVPLHFEVAFSDANDYPSEYGDQQYHIILLPEVWSLEGKEITDSMTNKIPAYIGNSSLSKILDPGGSILLTIGIVRPVLPELCSATPYALLEYHEKDSHPSCNLPAPENGKVSSALPLRLKVGFCTVGGDYESCTVIPCGQVYHTEEDVARINAIKEIDQTNQKADNHNLPPDNQIAGYVRHIFEDKNGQLWFGTNGYGVVHYTGDSVTYYSIAQGFGGQQITGIAEDLEKNLWFATDQGVVKYDWSMTDNGGLKFINFPSHVHFNGQRFWSISTDIKGNIWAGAERDIFQFDGKKWKTFALPYPEIISGNFITGGTTWSILEDRDGNYWFSTNGHGVYKYDGNEFTQYAKIHGLAGNSVNDILEDRNGNIWLATRDGGVSRFDGENFVNYTYKDSIGNDEVCVIYEDKAGNIWMSSEGYGVYRYNRKSFTNFSIEQGLGVSEPYKLSMKTGMVGSG